MGSVLTWHMYVPESFACTLLTCSFHVLWLLYVTDSRGFKATMFVWIARIAFESDLIHATCNNKQVMFIEIESKGHNRLFGTTCGAHNTDYVRNSNLTKTLLGS